MSTSVAIDSWMLVEILTTAFACKKRTAVSTLFNKDDYEFKWIEIIEKETSPQHGCL